MTSNLLVSWSAGTAPIRRLLTISATLVVALVVGCARSEREAGVASEAAAREKSQATPGMISLQTAQDLAGRQERTGAVPPRFGDTVVTLIIRTGDARVEVRDIRTAVAQSRELAQRLGGHVANSSYQGGRYEVRSATLELKIPAERYDDAVAGLDRIGRVEYVNSRAEDVGEEYVDASARLANARRLEERLVALLTSRTGKLEEVLAVERELARIRGEIEQIEGRLRFLRTRAALSTLTVTLHEPEPLLGGPPGENPFVGALRRAWRNFIGFFVGMIAALGIIVPLAALAVAGWFGVRYLRRRLLPSRR